MSERFWRVLISGSAGILLFMTAAYGLRAFHDRKREPGRFRRDLAILSVLGFLLLFLAYLARSRQP